jgi:hypothetical protein
MTWLRVLLALAHLAPTTSGPLRLAVELAIVSHMRLDPHRRGARPPEVTAS